MTKISETDSAIEKLLDRTEELIRLGKLDDAEYFLNQIEKYKPGDLNVPFQRGMLLMKRDEHAKALEQFLSVHKVLPDMFENINNIATAHYKLRKYNEAAVYYNRALALRPNTDFVFAILAETQFRLGRLDEALANFKKALDLSPDMFSTHSNLLLTMLYADTVSPDDIAHEAGEFGRKVALAFPAKTIFDNLKDKNRKIRIGYISPDFRDHPVPYFLQPILQNHNRNQFEVYAYSSTLFDNLVMERARASVDQWRDIRHFNDEKICNLIGDDRIDILVDVTGHTSYNHLKVFALKPAPIQVTWLGYPSTTGLKSIDYRITDIHAEPPGLTEHLNTETLWRLPHIFAVYGPHENSPDVIDHPPFEDNGYITFGCFNNFVKVRDPVLAAWAQILQKVPDARLLVEIDGIDEPDFLEEVVARFVAQGMPMERVVLEPRKRSNQFVLYNKIDIALDPFPAVGGTTGMDTLWMGVPYVTLEGKHFGSRMGVSILTNAGLSELIAKDMDDYISIAVDLAKNRDRLKKMRFNLREIFTASPAMDQKLFIKNMEEAYRTMWNKYCDAVNS